MNQGLNRYKYPASPARCGNRVVNHSLSKLLDSVRGPFLSRTRSLPQRCCHGLSRRMPCISILSAEMTRVENLLPFHQRYINRVSHYMSYQLLVTINITLLTMLNNSSCFFAQMIAHSAESTVWSLASHVGGQT